MNERALDIIRLPLLLSTINATIWTIIIHTSLGDKLTNLEGWLYTDVVSATLAFLLVFRLNRTALRWWDTRRMWGAIVADCRTLADGIMTHMNHSPKERDEAIKWLGGFLIATKQHMRNQDKNIDCDELAGFLSHDEINSMIQANHPVLYCSTVIRLNMKLAFHVSCDCSAATGAAYSSQMCMLEQLLNDILNNMGGLERVKSTPLPIVFVTHLRSFNIFYLFSLPYLFGNTWGWGTIASVFLTSVALLGIDGAATECERPFGVRPNALNMEAFCLTGLDNIAQIVSHHSDFMKKCRSLVV